MEKITVLLRAMQFYGHIAHNMVKGDTFFSDHDFLGGLYSTYESEYDSVVERMLGLGKAVDLFLVHKKAATLVQDWSLNNIFKTILSAEESLVTTVEKEISEESKMSEGTKQLLGEIANQSEMRQYKIKQRMK